MRIVKKTIMLLVAVVMLISLSGTVGIEAKSKKLKTPEITVKTKKSGTYVRITIKDTEDVWGYELSITGKPNNTEYCDYIKQWNSAGRVEMVSASDYNDTDYIIRDGTKKKSVTYKNLVPGVYSIKVRAYQENGFKDGFTIWKYSKWTKAKEFTIKEAPAKGFATEYNFSDVKKGEIIKFGSYEQDLDYSNGKEVIEWIVLDKTDDSLFLVSKYALDRLPYNKKREKVYWKDCTLRKWLNEVFIKNAFNKTEREMIKDTKLANSRIYEDGANATIDKVFLLSSDDMGNNDYGFYGGYDIENVRYVKDINSRCAFAWYKSVNKYSGEDHLTKDGEDACWWWLRQIYESPSSSIVNINAYGQINGSGNSADDIDLNQGYFGGNSAGVRPAMYISIKSTT